MCLGRRVRRRLLLGVARQTLVAPFLGDLVAVVAELPIMLALSWWPCDWAIRRFGVPPTFRHRALMGAVAFALLMASELTVSLWGFGRGVGEHLATFLSPPAALGLGAQLCFAAFPLARLAFEPDRAVGGPAASAA